jgi:hypothetical protein
MRTRRWFMPKRYSMEMAGRAERLYCCEGRTLSEVAALTGVSPRTLKSWSVKFDWARKREEIGRSLMEIHTKSVLLRQRLIENALNTLSAGDVYAVAFMESIARKAAPEDSRDGAVPGSKAGWKRKGEEEAVAALERACHIRMGRLLADPGQMDLPAIRALEAASKLVRDLKAAGGHGGKKKRPGLSNEAVEEIRRKILGIRVDKG